LTPGPFADPVEIVVYCTAKMAHLGLPMLSVSHDQQIAPVAGVDTWSSSFRKSTLMKCRFRYKNSMHRTLNIVLSFLVAVVIMHVAWYASHPYIIDTIGRTNVVAALELAAGRPIYLTPDSGGTISMGYTPGFPLLGALVFKVLGFSRWVWSSIWATIDLIVLASATAYLFKKSGWTAALIPAAMLGCLFPVVWARGDVAAVGLFWLGWVLLKPISISPACEPGAGRSRLALAVLAFALSAFFKQTMLPASFITAAIWAAERTDIARRQRISSCLLFSLSIVVTFGLMLCAYIVIYHENASAMVQVMTLGKSHKIASGALIQYFSLYALATAVPTVAALNQVRNRWSIALLHLIGLSFLLYAAKDGGSWHHLLVLVLPWALCSTQTRPGKPYVLQDFITIAPALAVCTIGFVLMFRPAIATEEDVSAAKNLESVFTNLHESKGNVLIFDSDGVFAYPDAAYRHGFHTRWERGALEEWSAAERSIPAPLLEDIEKKRFQRIVIRGASGNFPSASAYGIPYKAMNDAIGIAYIPCTDIPIAGWAQYCPK
jgi:hypothetical protein